MLPINVKRKGKQAWPGIGFLDDCCKYRDILWCVLKSLAVKRVPKNCSLLKGYKGNAGSRAKMATLFSAFFLEINIGNYNP